ncbi:MAG: sarcosine oxidase subunit alpha family protein [Alphaproteobacteria bacterium]|jgi:sarcosine oxidase subunit alpha|nr:sarcosine oxidase subunit alpha family protein [Alphaproteobacteria bacterium]
MRRQRQRLDVGARIDRSQRLRFRFNGKAYEGFAGDTLASALLANGVRLTGRSFKYHRPRGIYSAGMEEPGAFVQLGAGAASEPNLRATQVELFDGLEAASVNCWPSLKFDIWALNDRMHGMLPAGFYYKTFMWPKSFWHRYEKVIRKGAGLGTAPAAPDHNIYDKRHQHCDVLVVGGGPAGISAALAAGRAGARTILVDEQAELGGALLGNGERIEAHSGVDWALGARAELDGMAEMRVLNRTTAFGYYDHNYLLMVERVNDHLGAPAGTLRQRLWKIRAAQVVLATGAIERPMIFSNNDRPGIMLAGAARTYVNRFGAKPGNRAVLFVNNNSAYRAALDLVEAGIRVEAIVDVRADPTGEAVAAVRERGIEVLARHAVGGALGSKRLSGVEVLALNDKGDGYAGDIRRLRCDLLCLSGGWNPTLHLFSQAGGKLEFDENQACFVPGEARQAVSMAGAANGVFALQGCLAGGAAAGRAAAAKAGFEEPGAPEALPVSAPEQSPITPVWHLPPVAKGERRFVDLHNDVTVSDIELAAREGYGAVGHMKRYTSAGMGPDQGRTGNVHALAILADIRGASIAEIGTTTFRPPYAPVPYGAMAGRDVGVLADPVRMTAMHGWHERSGAVFDDVGQWKRPWYYPRPGENMAAAVRRECIAARNGVVILDASTLGKIEIHGPDAAEFLNRVYTNGWNTLAVGRCRYGLMLGEDGMVMDDGVTSRLGEAHYFMTTTTGGAARVMAWMEDWLQCEWPDLKVYLTSVSEQWATLSVSGPNARRLLSELAEGVDLAPEAFPHMAVREGRVAGIDARIFRVSFTGELGYEVSVATSYGLALWQAFLRVGENYDLTPLGTEALHVLRAEKGYIAVGHDTDGSVTPGDLGMAWIVSTKKDFLGRRSLARSDTVRPDRKQLVGLLPEARVPEGAQIVAEHRRRPPMKMIGHVTSCYDSAALERPIALALIMGGRERIGETVTIPLTLEGRVVKAEIVSPVFYDAQGERLNV